MRNHNKHLNIAFCIALLIFAACQSNSGNNTLSSPIRDTLIKIFNENKVVDSKIKLFADSANTMGNQLQITAAKESSVTFQINKNQYYSSNERVIKQNDKPIIIGDLFDDKKKTGDYTIEFSDFGFGELMLEINLKNEVFKYQLPLKPELVTNTMESFYSMIEIEETVQLFPLDSLINQGQHDLILARKSYPRVSEVIKTADSIVFRKLIETERKIETEPRNAELFQILGELYIQINNPELYRTLNHCLIQSLNLGNNHVSLIYSLAYSEFLIGNYDKATDDYIKATQLGWTNDFYDLHDRLEVYLLRKGY